jgi:predicted small secreted protein
MPRRLSIPLLNAALAALFALGLAACENTIDGAGEDIEEMGDEVEEAT